MAVHKVKLIIGPEGQEHEFDAPDDTYNLDSAEAVGWSCLTHVGQGHVARALATWSPVKSTSPMDP